MRIATVLAVALLTTTSVAGTERAQASIRHYQLNIPRQGLDTALKDLAQQTGLQIGRFSGRIDGSALVGPVRGDQTPEQALKTLLNNTGLDYKIVSDTTIAVYNPKDTALSALEEGVRVSGQGEDSSENGLQLAQTPQGSTSGTPTPAPSKGEGRGEEKISEIIVTATKRSERLQDVPISITAITADEIDRRGLVSAGDYLRGIPGVNQVESGFGGQAIVIRGVESALAFQNLTQGPTVATYFGETPTSNSGGQVGSNIDIKLVDIERVEVLRGPQGTTFGNSSMGGAVRMIPVAPKLDRFEGKVAAGYSLTSGTGGDGYNVQGVANLPLINDKLALRATAYRYEESGFYRNRAGSDPTFQSGLVAQYGAQAFASDQEEVGASRFTGGRLAVLFQPSDALKFTLSYLKQETETDGYPIANGANYQQTIFQVAPEHVIRGQTEGLSDTEIDIANAVVEYDFGWSSLLATYSYLKGRLTQAVPISTVGIQAPGSFDVRDSNRERIGEIRLVTRLDGAWNFLAGLYVDKQYDDKDDRTYYLDVAPAPGASRFLGAFSHPRELKQKAAFGQISWEFLPGLTLTGGGRAYDYDRNEQRTVSGPLFGVPNIGPELPAEDSGSNFSSNLSYKPNDSTLLYAGWAQGFRLGRPQGGLLPTACDRNGDGLVDGTNVTIESTRSVRSDAVDSYELGGKFAFLDRRLTIDAALFRAEWSDIPVTMVHPSACLNSYTTNAGAARSEGVELQANFRVGGGLRVDVGGSWLDAELTETSPNQPGFVKGARLAGSPKVNANLGLQYEFPVGDYAAYVRADSIYVGPFYSAVQQSLVAKSGDYVKLDVAARVMIRNSYIDLFVHNLTNEDAYSLRSILGGYNLRPRSIGLQAGYQF